jgi:SAM-dependent methyltransferase
MDLRGRLFQLGFAGSLAVRRVASPLAGFPVLGSVYRIGKRLANRILERLAGIDTSRRVGYEGLEFGEEKGSVYMAASWSALPSVLSQSKVSASDVFLDVGSGKGRLLYQAAALYPFQRVIGVDLSEELNRVALANIERNRRRLRCQDVQVVTADAVQYSIPDEVTIVCMNNPFGGELFEAFMDGLVDSLRRHPRGLTLLYGNPIMHDSALRHGFSLVKRSGHSGEFEFRSYRWEPDKVVRPAP